jgi:outer membrane lipoprotein-sorting protein
VKPSLSAKLAICILMFLAVPTAFAFQGPQPFSADFSTTSSNGNVHMNGKFFFSLPKMRMDIADTGQRQNAGPFGGKMSMIVDGSSKTAYMLMTEQQMYMEFPMDQNNPMLQRMPKLQNLSSDPCSVGNEGDATCKKLGSETVNGRACDKWEVTNKSGKKETLWIDQKLHFPVKSSDGQITSEFTNIKEGAQDAALFKVPPGYRKFDASMMGGQRPH